MKIVFFGTSDVGIPVLEALLKEHQVLAVVTSPDAPVGRKQIITPSVIATFAEENDLQIFKPEKVKNNPEFVAELENLGADIFVVVSYGKIMPIELLNIPPLKTVNIHFSMLPKYRGASPIQHALLNGDTETGTTIFVLDELVDHGPIIAQETLAIQPDETFETLAPKLSAISTNLLLQSLPKYQAGEIIPQEQNHESATKAPLINKELGRIDWQKPAQQIYNQFRALKTWPGIWTTWHEQNIKILACHPTAEPEPGAITVHCGNNSLLAITQLQLEGKKPTSSKDFLNGYKDFSPDQLI